MTVYEEKIHAKIASVQDKTTRTLLGICEANRKYPLDCLNDSGLEKLVDYILSLEAR